MSVENDSLAYRLQVIQPVLMSSLQKKKEIEDTAKRDGKIPEERARYYCGYLWEAFKKAFVAYSEDQNDILLTLDAVKSLFQANSERPERLPLSLYTHTRDSGKLIPPHNQKTRRIEPPQTPLCLIFSRLKILYARYFPSASALSFFQ